MTYEDLEEKGYNYQQINQIIKAAQIGLNLSELKTDTPVWVMRKIIEINPEVCKACGICKRQCPVDAITGEVKQAHVINPEICIKWGACVDKCPFKAIHK